jgi:TonB family protein
MSLILVIEREATYSERIQGALAAEGWSVSVVGDRDGALAASQHSAPDLVVLSSAVAGAGELLARFARASGGPGVLVLHGAEETSPRTADGALAKPFNDEQLRVSVRRCLSRVQRAAAEAAAAEAASSGAQLTSRDLFGDLLAEVEEEVARPQARPAQPPRRTEEEVARQLEQTLSGVLSPARPAAGRPAGASATPPPVATPAAASSPAPPQVMATAAPLPTAGPPASAAAPPAAQAARAAAAAAPAAASVKPATPRSKASGEIDELLSQTLSGLGVGGKPKAKPAAPATPPQPQATLGATPAGPAPPSLGAPPQAAPPVASTATSNVVRAAPPPAAQRAPAAVSAPAAVPPAPARPVMAREERTPEPPRVEPPSPPPARDEPRREPPRQEPPRQEPPAVPPAKRSPGSASDPGIATQRVDVVRSAAPATPTMQFGQYTLLERVALGGMAEVWKARMKGMEGFQKTVAIKKILAHLTDSVDFVTMFIDEAKLAAQLNHPHIIHIYDLGKLDDDYYIAMEYVEGKDLRSILNTARKQSSPLPVGLALLIAARLASALDYAHRKRDFDNRELGLVHRDVSPQNVLISYEGDIKLCDFGIVKAVAKASKTQMGALKGKLQYMSPEQAWGRVVDARSDIFSLGSVLFEMLTGRRLFAGESEISVLESVRECRIQAPRELVPAVPEAVDAIVRRALAKDPDDRYQTAGEMQKELEAVLYSSKPTPGQGDLAAYMHRLHADEPAASLPAASAAGVEGSEREVPAVVPLSNVHEPEEGRRRAWVLPAAAAALAVAGLVAWLVLRGAGGGNPPAAGEQAAAPAPAAAVAPAALPAAEVPPEVAGTPADPTAELAQRVEQDLRAREEQLAAQLEEQRRRIQAELQQQPAPAAQPTTTRAAPPPPPAEPEPAAEPPAPEPVAETPPPPPPPVETPRPQPTAPPAPARVEPAAPAVREGELVDAGTPGLRSPVFVTFTKPEYPPMAKRLGVEGVVVLSVLVSESGQVEDVRLVRGVSQNVGLNEAAVRAARTARYRPATLSGVRVKTWASLSIPFRL